MTRVYLRAALFHTDGEEISYEWLVRGEKGNLSKVLSFKGLVDPAKNFRICPIGNREFFYRILSQEGT